MDNAASVTAPPKSARVLIVSGSVIFFGVALALGVLFWFNAEPPRQLYSIPAALAWVAVLSLPGFVAVLALRRHDPRLLWPAIVTGLLPAVLTIFSFGLVLVIPVLLWVQASLRWPNPRKARSWRRDLVPLAIPVFAILAGLTFFAHQDPACWDFTEDADGNVTYTRTAVHGGMQSGWFVGGESLTSVTSEGAGTSGSTCTSDRVTPLEGLIALGFVGVGGAVAVRTARQLPEPTTGI